MSVKTEFAASSSPKQSKEGKKRPIEVQNHFEWLETVITGHLAPPLIENWIQTIISRQHAPEATSRDKLKFSLEIAGWRMHIWVVVG